MRRGALTGWGILGTAIVVLLGSVLKRSRRVKAAREMNKRACDLFIRRHGAPDSRSIVRATYGVAREESREAYCEFKQRIRPGDLQEHLEETFLVPDDVDHQDAAMCLRWQMIQTDREERWRASWDDDPPLSTPKNRAWQAPPTYTFAGCSTKENAKLWRKCLNSIKADIAKEEDRQSRDNMRACLAWVSSHGYPSTDYCLVWAACGIATCTTQGEFSRFWAAHGQPSDRVSVYALGLSHADETVIHWRHGLATACLGVPPARVGYEETWPEYFVMMEWLDEISPSHVKMLYSSSSGMLWLLQLLAQNRVKDSHFPDCFESALLWDLQVGKDVLLGTLPRYTHNQVLTNGTPDNYHDMECGYFFQD
ncbi:hypothetical protein KVR01_010148 [Diaporthe batatas]|uniref:uncharacterized protein n=1 Tax=Diaporthe batatas TaxID=748121 RepID=UPI001D05769A|nr:uncharacterized protein KVR01_010148 [Diaporthe batatas]KAG8159511.1 hypothetical protein KVR01_010148 [Diaporthe batatas]